MFIGVGGITCILGGNLQSSNETVRSILIIFRHFNVCITASNPMPLAMP